MVLVQRYFHKAAWRENITPNLGALPSASIILDPKMKYYELQME
jgi:hypothetical protein